MNALRLTQVSVASILALVILAVPDLATAQEQQNQQNRSATAQAMLEEIVVSARRREENLQELPLSIQAINADAMQAQGIVSIEQISDFVPNTTLMQDNRKNDNRLFIRGIGGGFSNPARVFGVGMYIDGHYLSDNLGSFMSTIDIERVEVLRGPQGTLFGKNTTGGAISIITAKPHDEFESYLNLRMGSWGQKDLRGMLNVPLSDTLFLRANAATESYDGYYKNRWNNEWTGGENQKTLGMALRWQPSDELTIDARLGIAEDRDSNQAAQCRPYPDQETYDLLIGTANGGTPSNPLPFAGPDLVLGTADDVVYEGPGPFDDPGAGDRWGSNNDQTAYRLENFGPGGSNFREDALYPGALANYLNFCNEVWEAGDRFVTYQDMNERSYVDNDMWNINAVWTPADDLGPFQNPSLQVQWASRYSSYRYQHDRDFGPGIIDHVGNYPNIGPRSRGIRRDTDEFEAIFSGDIGERVTLTAGLYWFDDVSGSGNYDCLNDWQKAYDPTGGDINPDTGAPYGTINGQFDDDITCIPEGGTLTLRMPGTPGQRRMNTNAGRVTGESKALYAHSVFHLTDQWDLSLGIRYMEEDRSQENFEYNPYRGGNDCTVITPGEYCDIVYTMNRDTIIDNGVYVDQAAGFDDTIGLISLTRFLGDTGPLDSGIIYATISEGWMTGAFNDELSISNPDLSPQQLENLRGIIPYGPEYLTNYEVGFKGTMLGGDLQISAALFQMDYTDKHENISVPNPDERLGPTSAINYVQNAASVDIKGIELELRASPWPGGFIAVDGGYLTTEYATFLVPDLENLNGPPIDASQENIPTRIPKWTVTARVEHEFGLSSGATITPMLSVYSQADYEWQGGLDRGQKTATCHQDSYAKFRGRVTYRPAQGNWQASVFGYNITDEEILHLCNRITPSGVVGYWYERPATWGAEFTMNFGSRL